MKFQKGMPRPANAGRRAGTKNKLTPLRESLAAAGFDLGKEALKFFAETEDPGIKLKLLEMLAKYTQVVPTTEPESDETPEVNPALDATPEELREALS